MSGMTVPFELRAVYGQTMVYNDISQFGWLYWALSPVMFVVFTDALIYWIHRGLHWGPLYKIHKLHHHFKETTPFSAFHFHPLDGFAQGFPYHVFVHLVPFHNVHYTVFTFLVGLWTINIHDRVTFRWWGVNGAAHHTIHHTKYLYNYGQFFTFWDRVCGTFKDPLLAPQYNRDYNWPKDLKPSEKVDIYSAPGERKTDSYDVDGKANAAARSPESKDIKTQKKSA